MIPKSFVQDLLNRVDIVDVIESYVPLKRAGANLTACCPFHSEKTPSFTVSPSKQFYHCFGCGAHGSAVGFLIEYGGLSFVEAVKDLATRAGLRVPEAPPYEHASGSGAGETGAERLTQVLEQALQFYKAQLRKAEPAIDYLKRRGLTGAVAARFGLGYAPAGWQGLAAAIPDYSSRAPVDAGLVVQGEDGKRYDRFRNRIMFPILSQRGQIIGFGGRVLDQSEPKYLNSPETALFEKGRELYGLFQARQAIREAGRVVVVEGYMDVVALAQFGVGYAVATLGTATTPRQVQKLLRQTDEVVFCFDGDSAGRRAAWRALENSLEQLQDGKQVRFLFLPDGHDPDSFVRAQGRAAFEGGLAQALPLSGFMLKELSERADLASAEGRAKFLQDAAPLVKRIGAPIFRNMLQEQLAHRAQVEVADLVRLGVAAERIAPKRALARSDRLPPSLMRSLARCVMREPKLAETVESELLNRLAGSAMGSEQERRFLAEYLKVLQAGRIPRSLSEEFRGTGLESLAAGLEQDDLLAGGAGPETVGQEFADGWLKVQAAADSAERQALEPLVVSGQATAEQRERYRSLQGRSPTRVPI